MWTCQVLEPRMSPCLRRCSLIVVHFLNTPTNKFVLFLVFQFSLEIEVFNSSITSLLKQETSRACVSDNQVQVIISHSYLSNFAYYMIIILILYIKKILDSDWQRAKPEQNLKTRQEKSITVGNSMVCREMWKTTCTSGFFKDDQNCIFQSMLLVFRLLNLRMIFSCNHIEITQI